MQRKRLYPFEQVAFTGRFPALAFARKGNPGQPLMVFITGGGILARIAYGAPENNERDFLAYWALKQGHSFLALSYPMEHPVFPSTHPGFTVQDWGAQSAELIFRTIQAYELPPQAIVWGWSMAGRIAVPLTKALKRHGIRVELFISLVGSPPAPNLLFSLKQAEISKKGLTVIPFSPYLKKNLRLQDQGDKPIVSDKLFREEFLANFPINLANAPLRYRRGRFVSDWMEDLVDTEAFNYAELPFFALISVENSSDPRHALMDKEVWGFYIAQALYQLIGEAALQKEHSWKQLYSLFKEGRLSCTVKGGHFFFVGEEGAKRTVNKTLQLLKNLKNCFACLSDCR